MSLSDVDVTTIVKALTGSGFVRLVYESDAVTLRLHQRAEAAALSAQLESAPEGPEQLEVIAPRLGLLRRKAAAGNALAEGEVIAELDVLGTSHPITAKKAGRLGEWLAEDGSLVEWGALIATLEIE